MILTVISGKGGTGKTSMVASFAAIAKPLVLVDCDVDAANLHLIADPKIIRKEIFKAGKLAFINPDLCTACGECVEHCRFDAIKEVRENSEIASYVVDPLNCEGCSVCAEVCPAQAVEMIEQTCGEWYVSDTRFGPMVHARLGIGSENSGKLVTEIRREAESISNKKGLDLILVDGPPGTGCPVIASMTGADAVLAVTEPTMSGLADLKRVAELAEHFKIKMGVCVNKHDLNPDIADEIENYCSEKDIMLEGKIDFDDQVTRSMVKGKALVECGSGKTADQIKSVWKNTTKNLLQERNISMGRIISVNISKQRSSGKKPESSVLLKEEYGIEGDAHAGKAGTRHVSILAWENILEMKSKGIDAGPGDFAENITTEGIDMAAFKVGAKIRLGQQALVEIIGIGKPEWKPGDYNFKGEALLAERGAFARILAGGLVKPGDAIIIEE